MPSGEPLTQEFCFHLYNYLSPLFFCINIGALLFGSQPNTPTWFGEDPFGKSDLPASLIYQVPLYLDLLGIGLTSGLLLRVEVLSHGIMSLSP